MNAVVCANGLGAAPVEELFLDGVALGVIANRALTAVAIRIEGGCFARAVVCYQFVHGVC